MKKWNMASLAPLLFLLLTINCSLLTVSAQTQFQLTIGGVGDEFANSIIQTTDGGYAIAGSTEFFGAGLGDFYIVKLDGSGTLQWTRTVGGTNNDYGFSIIQTTDGGYAVAGYTSSFGAGGYDICIVKLDGSGTPWWTRTIGGTGADYANSIIQTADGGYAVAGYTTSFGAGNEDMYIVKLDSSGTLLWSRTVGGPNYDDAFSIIQSSDGGYAVGGSTFSTFSFGLRLDDFYILKLDIGGNLQWSRTIDGINDDDANSIIQATDGGYVVAGDTWSFGGGLGDFYIVKLSGSGMLQWSRSVGGPNYEHAFSITRTTDGGYAVAGFTFSYGAGNSDFYIVKFNDNGLLQWSRTVGGPNYDDAHSIIQTTDGGSTVVGPSGSFGAGAYDFYIVKFDANGNTCGNSSSPSSISGSGGTLGSPTSIVTSPTPTVTSPTPTTNTGGTLTTICVIGIQPISNEIPASYRLYQNYPNPFNPTTRIRFDNPPSPLSERGDGGFVKLIVYDLLGKEIATLVNEQLNPGTYSVEWDASDFPSGIYYYRLSAGDALTPLSVTETKKMVLLK